MLNPTKVLIDKEDPDSQTKQITSQLKRYKEREIKKRKKERK